MYELAEDGAKNTGAVDRYSGRHLCMLGYLCSVKCGLGLLAFGLSYPAGVCVSCNSIQYNAKD